MKRVFAPLLTIENNFINLGRRYSHNLPILCTIVIILASSSIISHIKPRPKASKTGVVSEISPAINPNSTPCVGDEKEYKSPIILSRNDLSTALPPQTLQKIQLLLKEENVLPEGTDATYSYSPKLNAISYISRMSDSDTDTSNDLLTVYIYFLDTKERRKIFELRNKGSQGDEYVFGLSDTGFSDDGSYLAILTSEDLYLYDVQSTSLTHEFHEPRPKDIGVGGVFWYGNPKFSSDNTKILLSLGYYEGGSNAVYDRTTKKLTSLPYSIYGEGESSVDWYNNQLILFRVGYNEDQKKEITELKLVDFPTLSETLISKVEMGNVLVYFDKEKTLYVSGEEFVPTNVMECQKGERREVIADINNLYKIDIPTGNISKILEIDATSKGNYMNIRNITYVDGRLILKVVDKYEGNFPVVEVDPQNKNTLINLGI